MLKSFCDFLLNNQDNITFILALIGSIGTICGWAYTFVTTRKRIDIDIVDYTTYGNVVQFFMNIQNKSFSSICINAISFRCNKKLVCCELIPKKIRGIGDDIIKTPMFPLNLASHQGCLHFFEFVNCPDTSLTPDKKVAFEIHTNRGVLKKSIILGTTEHYLHIE